MLGPKLAGLLAHQVPRRVREAVPGHALLYQVHDGLEDGRSIIPSSGSLGRGILVSPAASWVPRARPRLQGCAFVLTPLCPVPTLGLITVSGGRDGRLSSSSSSAGRVCLCVNVTHINVTPRRIHSRLFCSLVLCGAGLFVRLMEGKSCRII